ncbi:hypothetical protein [Oscillatoria sp. FACHB-1406]|uniref:hypothetical protein n=1 Tax=Oscillatoria sp. FACHB-1406 TaxID=2692846 RepID=UPI00168A3087|nr:hypothetical protein [Oscillatoria sp. FACHB-1406]MBD2577910.1 hypothetical protein [Oscillatoria sp. FACHB-1406]
MDYLIAIFPDRLKAEEAYTALEKEALPTSQIAILGRGYKTAEEFGLGDPKAKAKKQALLMALWIVPFGFIAGFVFNLQTGIEIVPALGGLGNHILGGLFGAIGGAMGSFFVGGGVALTSGNDSIIPYRDRLAQGQYLVVVGGTPNLQQQARPILRRFTSEPLQTYADS